MKIETKAYGSLEIDERQRIRIPMGLYGFEAHEEYALLDAARPPFFWLQSLKARDVAFVLLDPVLIRPDYDAALDPCDFEDLELSGPDDGNCLLFVIVTIRGGQGMTVNMAGPVVINKKSRRGRQCISRSDKWQVQHDLSEELSSRGNSRC